MNQGKYIFAQLTDFLPRRVFDRIVSKHDGNKYIKSFTCWNQMLCMVFGQLTSRDSMRDLLLSLEAHKSKYQIGKLETYYPSRDYPEQLRRIKYYDSETNKELIFLTNNMELKPTDIAYLYKKRWEVELFY